MARAVKTGLHVETFLCVMGALAGFAAQMGMREEFIGKQKKSEQDIFKIFKTANNFLYYGGPNLGALLTDTPHSIFKLSGTLYNKLGGRIPLQLKWPRQWFALLSPNQTVNMG